MKNLHIPQTFPKGMYLHYFHRPIPSNFFIYVDSACTHTLPQTILRNKKYPIGMLFFVFEKFRIWCFHTNFLNDSF